MGLTTHLGVAPPVLGGKAVAELLTQGLTDVIGGKFYIETDALKAAQGLIEDIRAKRKKLGLSS
jgi:carbon-monoxide dehydrogenase catalytic subunit